MITPRGWWRLALAALAFAIGSSSCSKQIANATPEVHTDLTKLGGFVRLPAGVTGARWVVRPVRPPGSALPGPTDSVLVAYLETSANFWTEQGFHFGSRTPTTHQLRAEDARALLPSDVLARATPRGNDYELACEKLDGAALSTAIRKVSAFRCGDGIWLSVFLG